MRIDAAEEYLARAKEYRVDTKAKIAEINQVKQLVIHLEHTQEEELEMLSMIREAYLKQSEDTLIESANLLRDIASLSAKEVCKQTDEQYERLLKALHGLWG